MQWLCDRASGPAGSASDPVGCGAGRRSKGRPGDDNPVRWPGVAPRWLGAAARRMARRCRLLRSPPVLPVGMVQVESSWDTAGRSWPKDRNRAAMNYCRHGLILGQKSPPPHLGLLNLGLLKIIMLCLDVDIGRLGIELSSIPNQANH